MNGINYTIENHIQSKLINVLIETKAILTLVIFHAIC